MGRQMQKLHVVRNLFFAILLMVRAADSGSRPTEQTPSASKANLAQLIGMIHERAKSLENSSGMRLGFRSFTAAYKVPPQSVSYSDYVAARLLYEATRDAGFWNLHWTITDQPPNSDNIWRQWQRIAQASPVIPTASAECDELSALYAFLAERAGIKGVGLFWPFPNHTVAVWVIPLPDRNPIRVVIPTSQIFLGVTDSFGTRKFNPWKQKSIYEYKRRDAPDALELPKPLFDFFLSQMDKYAGASDSTVQQLRYLREGVFLKYCSAEEAAHDALRRAKDFGSGPAEDLSAFQNFAQDMKLGVAK